MLYANDEVRQFLSCGESDEFAVGRLEEALRMGPESGEQYMNDVIDMLLEQARLVEDALAILANSNDIFFSHIQAAR